MKNTYYLRVDFARWAASAALAIGLAACASTGDSNENSLLTAAGFRARKPETLEQRRLFDAAESYHVLKGTKDGRVFYAYKDEKRGVAYVGGEEEYRRFKDLAVQENIARANEMAASLDRDSARGWYQAFNPIMIEPLAIDGRGH